MRHWTAQQDPTDVLIPQTAAFVVGLAKMLQPPLPSSVPPTYSGRACWLARQVLAERGSAVRWLASDRNSEGGVRAMLEARRVQSEQCAIGCH